MVPRSTPSRWTCCCAGLGIPSSYSTEVTALCSVWGADSALQNLSEGIDFDDYRGAENDDNGPGDENEETNMSKNGAQCENGDEEEFFENIMGAEDAPDDVVAGIVAGGKNNSVRVGG